MLALVIFALFGTTPVSAQAISDWQNQIVKDVEKLYRPLAASEGLKLTIEEDTQGSLAVASAENDGVHASVIVQSGMFRSPRLTPDALRLIICHELGHIFGGAPRRHVPPDWTGAIAADGLSLMSAEGQADYYASMICFPRLVQGQNHAEVLKKENVDEATKKLCAQKNSEEEILICQRTAAGALAFLNLVKDFGISIATPDTSVATKLDRDTYPFRQCRLDTFMAGALCQSRRGLRLDALDPVQSGCESAQGQRPACWYPSGNL